MTTASDDIRRIAGWLATAHHGVAFTGAGISTESGIPDFRSPSGVWSQQSPVYFQDFLSDADERRRYWNMRRQSIPAFLAAKPNEGHRALAEWESRGLIRAVITQNIDELHQRAGSLKVLEIHGTALKVRCLSCDRRWPCEFIQKRQEAGETEFICEDCGGLLKSLTVSFGETMPPVVWMEARQLARRADVFLAMGSSLVVHPAAELPELAKSHGARLIIINRDPTPLDEFADVVIHAPIGETMSEIMAAMSDAAPWVK